MNSAEAAIAMTLQNSFMKKLGVDANDADAMHYFRVAFRSAFPKCGWPTNWGTWPTPKPKSVDALEAELATFAVEKEPLYEDDR